MSKRTGVVATVGIGLLLLAQLTSSASALPATGAAQGAQPWADPARDTWVFSLEAEEWAVPDWAWFPFPGIGFTLYGSQQGDRPGGTTLDSGTTDATGHVNLRASTAYPYFHVVVSSVPPDYAITWISCPNPQPSCIVQRYDWLLWDAAPPGTYAGYLELAKFEQPSPTPTLTPSSLPFTILSGRVYEGNVGVEPPPLGDSSPIRDAVVQLYCSMAPYPSQGNLIATAKTDKDGYYGLGVTSRQCAYYHIIQTNKGPYNSQGATSVGGTVKSADWITYQSPLFGKTWTGNKFWDKLPPTPTPTRSPTRMPPATATPADTPTRELPTATMTRTPTDTRTPTGTITVAPSPTPTSTRLPEADLELQLHHFSPSPAGSPPPGTDFYEMLTVRNHGPDLVNHSVITLSLPSGLSAIAGAYFCNPAQGGFPTRVVRCEAGLVAPGLAFSFLIAVDDEDVACDTVAITGSIRSELHDPNLSNNDPVEAISLGPCKRQDLVVTKTLIDPASGQASAGDGVRFRVDVHNPNAVAVGGFQMEDTYQEAEFGAPSASVPWDASLSDGTDHVLVWQNLSLPPDGTISVTIELKAKLPGITATNCARFVVPSTGANVAGVAGPDSCAPVNIVPAAGRQFTVSKKLISPGSHVAKVGDTLSFEQEWKNGGTESGKFTSMNDYIFPPSVAALTGGYSYGTAKYSLTRRHYKALAAAFPTPAINTAEWTVTWPDGTQQTKIAKDYVFILDGEVAEGLFIDKRLVDPIGGADVGDPVTFRVTITNATGIDLPTLSLADTYPAGCLAFSSASVPPDSVSSGALAWNNLGPLPLGSSLSIDLHFSANAVCPAALNCAQAGITPLGSAYQQTGACAPVSIRGPRPELAISKVRETASPVAVGDVVQWRITLTNTGTAALATVSLEDLYPPPFFRSPSAVPAADVVDAAGGYLQWTNLGPLALGQSTQVVVRLEAAQPGLQLQNCARAEYSVGSSHLARSDCDVVDVLTNLPSIDIQKERLAPDAQRPVATGEEVTYRLTVRNTGQTPLANVVVQDPYDPNCLAFVASPGSVTQVAPGTLRWETPTLAVGQSWSWVVIFWVKEGCPHVGNCVSVQGDGPQGVSVSDQDCNEFATEAPSSELVVTKRLAEPHGLPLVGSVIHFEIMVQNTGNQTLQVVHLHDGFDPACLGYVSALPAPDAVAVGPEGGEVQWLNVGPLAPGEATVVHVYLRAISSCGWYGECGRATWLVNGIPRLEAIDCLEVARGEPRPIYLPLVMKQHAS